MTIHSNPKQMTCPDCGLTLRKNAPAGLCPACLLRAFMGSKSETGRPVDAEPSDHSAAMEAKPAFVEELAAQPGSSITELNSGLPPANDHPYPGTTLRYFGDYELHEEIARGGMGVVYRLGSSD